MKSKTRLIILGVGMCIAIYTCYTFAISNTLVLKKEYHELSKELLFFNTIPEQLAQFNQKKAYYNTLLSEMNLDNTSLENNFLRTLNQLAHQHDLIVIDFNTPHIYVSNNGIKNTYTFTLQGNFTSILLTLHELELNRNFGEVIHTDFIKKRNYKTNKDYLTATIFLQSIK